MFGRIGTTEIILLVCLALVIFGGSRISGIGKALGSSIRDFKREINAPDQVEVAGPPAEELEAKAEAKKETL